jgi:hypothetical protein
MAYGLWTRKDLRGLRSKRESYTWAHDELVALGKSTNELLHDVDFPDSLRARGFES